jgi:hypothetical protein
MAMGSSLAPMDIFTSQIVAKFSLDQNTTQMDNLPPSRRAEIQPAVSVVVKPQKRKVSSEEMAKAMYCPRHMPSTRIAQGVRSRMTKSVLSLLRTCSMIEIVHYLKKLCTWVLDSC